MKRSPLKRKTPLKPGKPLQRKTTLKRGGKLKPRSRKRQQQYDSYLPKRQAYLREHPICEIPGCCSPSSDIHHVAKRNGDRLLDEPRWLAVCRECHGHIETHRDWAYQEGFLSKVVGCPSENR